MPRLRRLAFLIGLVAAASVLDGCVVYAHPVDHGWHYRHRYAPHRW